MDLVQKYLIDDDEVEYRVIDGEAVILNLGNSCYYGLNKIGTKIWEFMNKKKNIGEILGMLKKEYPGVSEQQLKNDLSEFMKTLEKEKLVIPAS